ncbi:restriction endonuclease subunit S [Streptococcus suis]|nr:restriction endonuclease subunit S [Streptococcus suis]MBS8085574.1 restriction endonuclease subunit S [Streptococcus suis]
MTKIEEMIAELCPNGVEWKELGEICKIETGKLNANAAVENGIYPFFTTAREISWINSFRWDAEALLIAGNANVGDVKYYSGKFEAYQRTYVLTNFTNSINVRYLFHYVKYQLKAHLERNTKKAAMSYIVLSTLKSFSIPIPPLKIQEEIVQILDKFTEYVTELTAELTAELTKRQKQYSFYRDKLLSFEDEVYQVEWKTLGEVGLPTENIFWKSQGEQCFSYIDLSSVDRDSKKITETTEITKYTAPSRAQKIVKENDIIFGTTRPTLRRYAKIPLEFDNQICSTGFYVFRASDEVLPDYIYHIFGSNAFNNFVEENQSGASYPAISNSLVEQYKLPVPSKKVQSRIVQVLDNFDAVCNDLNIGLPKEIEQRQKQYEYFREKLLTFTAEGVYPGQWTVDSGQ